MYLTELKMYDFRNHGSIDLSFSPYLNCFIGNNAMGKTNILEAVYYLSTLASFRAAKDEDLIRWGKEAFSLMATLQTKNYNYSLKTKVSSKRKIYLINDAKKEKSSDFVGHLKTVFFSPEDLSLIKGGPQYRRSFLDHFLSQLFPSYHHYLVKYKKLLRQKNVYLRELKTKKTVDFDLLEVYNQQLVQIAAWITLKRLNILKKILPLAKEYHAKINMDEELNLNYQSCVPLDSTALTYEYLTQKYLVAVKDVQKEEIAKCMSLVGPQRDDVFISVNKKNLKEYGSQGQQRTATIALKLAQAEVFRSELGENPIILLDDIFSELDEKRRNNILDMITRDMQVFITATDKELIPEIYRKEAIIFKLTKENVLQEG